VLLPVLPVLPAASVASACSTGELELAVTGGSANQTAHGTDPVLAAVLKRRVEEAQSKMAALRTASPLVILS